MNKHIIITAEQINYLSKQGVDVKPFIEKNEFWQMLDFIDDAIVENMVTNKVEPDEPDEIGIKMQKIYDEIRFVQNDEDEWEYDKD